MPPPPPPRRTDHCPICRRYIGQLDVILWYTILLCTVTRIIAPAIIFLRAYNTPPAVVKVQLSPAKSARSLQSRETREIEITLIKNALSTNSRPRNSFLARGRERLFVQTSNVINYKTRTQRFTESSTLKKVTPCDYHNKNCLMMKDTRSQLKLINV